MVVLPGLGSSPAVETCAVGARPVAPPGLALSAAAGGVVGKACQARQRERRALSAGAWQLLRALAEPSGDWNRTWNDAVRKEVRQVLGHYVTYLLGRRPRMLPYLGS